MKSQNDIKGANLPGAFQPTKDKVLIPGKLYAIDFMIDNYNDLYKLREKSDFTKEEKNDMEAMLKAQLKEAGHDCEFAEFLMKTIKTDVVFHQVFDTVGTLDLMHSGWIKPALPKKTVRVYFRVRSITAVILIGIIAGILVATLAIGTPYAVELLEAINQPLETIKDLGMGVIQEPRKILELGAIAFVPLLALMAGFGYFILKKKVV